MVELHIQAHVQHQQIHPTSLPPRLPLYRTQRRTSISKTYLHITSWPYMCVYLSHPIHLHIHASMDKSAMRFASTRIHASYTPTTWLWAIVIHVPHTCIQFTCSDSVLYSAPVQPLSPNFIQPYLRQLPAIVNQFTLNTIWSIVHITYIYTVPLI